MTGSGERDVALADVEVVGDIGGDDAELIPRAVAPAKAGPDGICSLTTSCVPWSITCISTICSTITSCAEIGASQTNIATAASHAPA